MASNIVDISILSPFQFTKVGFSNPAIYNTKWKEDYQYIDTIRPYYERTKYFQPVQSADIFPVQIISNYAPHQLDLFRCDGSFVVSFLLAYVPSSIEVTGQRVYEANIAFNAFDEGAYYFVLSSGSPILEQYTTNIFYISAYHENTVLLESTHDENDYDTVFENGFVSKLRVHGSVVDFTPASERVVFIDQPANITQLSANGFSTESFVIGDQDGVPDIFIEKINQHFRCYKVLIDGKQYVGTQGSRFEATREDFVPMTGWRFEIREKDASTKKRFIADGLQGTPTTVTYNIQNKGFGAISNPASQNIIQIENLN
jgi:hypothetical protein